MGLAVMIGQISAVFALGGSDAAAHMSEECQGAGVSVARAMFWTVLGNGAMGFAALIAFIFSIPSVSDALNDPSGFPLIYALKQRVDSNVILGFTFMNFLVLMVSNVAYQASVSRQTFAFARDGGLPFSKWIGHVNQKYHLPINAILLSATITILVCLINLGSSDAFNAILSLAAVAQMGTYSISITCVLYRRITAPHLLPTARWTLGRWGIPVNAVGAAYSWFVFFFGFWPSSTPVAASSMNYAVVMFGGVVILSLVYYFVRAKRAYAGPVTKTEGYME